MTEEFVAVPKSLLVKLEEDRENLFKAYCPEGDIFAIVKLQEMTKSMWELSHRRWKSIDIP